MKSKSENDFLFRHEIMNNKIQIHDCSISHSHKELEENNPSKTFGEESNIYVVFTKGLKKKLTFNYTDSHPMLLPSNEQKTCVRNQNISGFEYKKIMIININDLREKVLTDKNTYKDGLTGKSDI